MGDVVALYDAYTLNRISWTRKEKAIRAGDNTIEGYEVDIIVTGVVRATTAAAQAAVITALGAFRKNGKDFKIWDGTTTITDLTAADCKGGGPNVEFSIVKSPHKVGFNTPVSLHVWGRLDPTKPDGNDSDILTDESTTTYTHDAQDRIKRTKKGTIRVTAGTNVQTKKEDVDPGTSADTYLTAESDFEGYVRIGETWDIDSAAEVAEYSFDDEAYYVPTEGDLKDLKFRVREEDDGEQKTIRISGSAGADAGSDIESVVSDVESLIESKLPEGAKRISQAIDKDERNNRVTFSVMARHGGDDDLLLWDEQETYRTTYQKEFMPYIGGGGEVAEYGSPIVVKTQSGRAEGLTDWPDFPAKEDDGFEVIDEQEITNPAKKRFDGELVFGISWSYQYKKIEGGSVGGGGGDIITGGIIVKRPGSGSRSHPVGF